MDTEGKSRLYGSKLLICSNRPIALVDFLDLSRHPADVLVPHHSDRSLEVYELKQTKCTLNV